SVAAGVAGTAGIGLIAGSRLMKPKNPEALLPPKQDTENMPLGGLGAEETQTVEKILKTKYSTVPKPIYHQSKLGSEIDRLLLQAVDAKNLSVDDGIATPNAICSCVQQILRMNNEYEETNEKNILLVRHALDNHCRQKDKLLTEEEDKNALKSEGVINAFNKIVDNAMQTMPKSEASYRFLQIFREAINLKGVDIPKPQQNPDGEEIAGNLIGNENDMEINNISMQAQAPELPKEIRFDAQGAGETLTALEKLGVPKEINGAKYELEGMLERLHTQGSKGLAGSRNEVSTVVSFVQELLKRNGINNYDPSPKKVLLVRHVIARYLAQNPDEYPEALKILNSKEGRQACCDVLENEMNSAEVDEYNLLAIFRAAISETDLATLDSNANLVEKSRLNSANSLI
ncbi:MAG: hypothetical protein J5838_01835, partial [Desulfovibrio sp.]|nr:hypothetical protein [Desulfovibrio sp.]